MVEFKAHDGNEWVTAPRHVHENGAWRRVDKLTHPVQVVATGGRPAFATASSAQTQTDTTTHTLTTGAAGLQIVFDDIGWDDNRNADVTYQATATIGGAAHTVTFSGATTGTCPAGGLVVSDPVGDFPAGSVVSVESTCIAPSGRTVGVDYQGLRVMPYALIGAPETLVPAVSVFGSSSPAGAGDTTGSGGYMDRGLTAASVAYVNCSRGGTRSEHFDEPKLLRIMPHPEWFTHGVAAAAANDVDHGLTAAQDYVRGLWGRLYDRGLVVYQQANQPRTASSDGWTTVSGQSHVIDPTWGTDMTAVNDEFNDWCAPLVGSEIDGFLDIMTPCEPLTDPGTGIWRVDMGALTADGRHPNTAGHAHIAATVSAWGDALTV